MNKTNCVPGWVLEPPPLWGTILCYFFPPRVPTSRDAVGMSAAFSPLHKATGSAGGDDRGKQCERERLPRRTPHTSCHRGGGGGNVSTVRGRPKLSLPPRRPLPPLITAHSPNCSQNNNKPHRCAQRGARDCKRPPLISSTVTNDDHR